MGCCVVLGRRGLGLAWSKRSLSCLVGEVLVLRIGRRGLGSVFWSAWVTEWVFFFFFFFFKYGFFFRWDFGGQWPVVAWWKRGGGDWAVEAM